MAHLHFMDELIREYLTFRGLGAALKSFDADLTACKDQSFRVDRIMEVLTLSVQTSDLNQLRSVWSYMEQKVFSRLETHQQAAARDLGTALLRRYVTQAASQGTAGRERVNEFFDRLTPELQHRPEWKDWFVLPFVRNPEESATFSVFFTRHWQETLHISLHNFLSIVFQCMPLPTLARYQQESALILRLQRENMDLRGRLETLTDGKPDGIARRHAVVDPPAPVDIMDDFIVVAQETPSVSDPPASSSSKSLRSLIRAIGNTSPQTSRRAPDRRPVSSGLSTHHQQQNLQAVAPVRRSLSSGGPRTAAMSVASGSCSGRLSAAAAADVDSLGSSAENDYISGDGGKPMLLSQESVSGHSVTVTHALFSPGGDMLATTDVSGVLNVWTHSPPPPPEPLDALRVRSAILACCWLTKQLLVYGTRAAELKLYDVTKRRHVIELSASCLPVMKDKRVMHVCRAGRVTSLLMALSSQSTVTPLQTDLVIFDLKAGKDESTLHLPLGVTPGGVKFNHNGQLMLVACSDGHVRVYDGRMDGCISDWTAHTGPVHTLQLSPDQTRIYSLGADNKLIGWSLQQPGSQLLEEDLPASAIYTSSTAGATYTSSTAAESRVAPCGRLFALSRAGTHVVVCCGSSGARLYRVCGDRLQSSLHLGGHSGPVVTCDMSVDNSCVTASVDGSVTTSSLLVQD